MAEVDVPVNAFVARGGCDVVEDIFAGGYGLRINPRSERKAHREHV